MKRYCKSYTRPSRNHQDLGSRKNVCLVAGHHSRHQKIGTSLSCMPGSSTVSASSTFESMEMAYQTMGQTTLGFYGSFPREDHISIHSKWIEATCTSSTSSSCVIEELRTLFAKFGLPETIVTDNGTGFTSQEFKTFLDDNGIRHVTSAPYHPASNGLAERAV